MNNRFHLDKVKLIEARAGCGESRTSGSSGGRVSERNPSYPNQFKIGASHFRGPKLDMELVGAQISEGEFFGYPLQKWLAVLFIDPEGVLSSILFKTESLDQFEELRRSYRLKGESLLGKTIRAHMCKRASRASGNGYFAVEFEVVSDGKYADAIAQFRQLHYTPGMIRLLESKPDAENGNGNAENGNGKKK
jgi:hypothetical protein